MKKLILAALLNCGFAHAMNAADTNLFVSALKNGTSTAPIPNDRQFAPAIKSLQTMTGDSGFTNRHGQVSGAVIKVLLG